MDYFNPRFTKNGSIEIDVEIEGFDGRHQFHVLASEMAELDQLIRQNGGIAEYVAPPDVAPDPERDLSPARFEWLLAKTGLGDAWDALEAVTHDADRDTYAVLKGQRAQPVFRLAKVLASVEGMAPMIAQIAPEADISETTIRAAWAQALEVKL